MTEAIKDGDVIRVHYTAQKLRFEIDIVETGFKPTDLFQEPPGGS